MQTLQRNSFPEDSNAGGFHEDNAQPALSSVRTVNELMQEIKEPRQMATDTQQLPETSTGDSAGSTTTDVQPEPEAKKPFFSFAPPPVEEDPAPADPEPMFPGLEDKEEKPDQGKPAEEPNKYALTAKKAERKFNIMFKVRDNLQSRLLALYADDDDRDQFRMDAEDREILADYYLQVIEENGGKIPWYLDLVLVEGSVLLPKLQMAKKLKKVNAENARLRAELQELKENSTVGKAIVLAPQKERKNWKIDVNGFYEKDEHGTYVQKANRTDKASLKDIEQIVFYNSRSTVQKAFSLSDEEINKLYSE